MMMSRQRDAGLTVICCMILVICLVFAVIYGQPSGREETRITDDIRDVPDPLRPLFDAIRQVESGGNDQAVGDGGTSRGPYQISRAYWEDACEQIGSYWDYNTYVWIDPVCEHIMNAYWLRYGATTDEERMALHVAGPTGIKKMKKSKQIQDYIKKVQAEMKGN